MFLRYALTTLGAIAILAWTSWRLTLVMLALVPVAVIGALFYGRWVRRLSRKVQDALAAATDVAEETFSGVRNSARIRAGGARINPLSRTYRSFV